MYEIYFILGTIGFVPLLIWAITKPQVSSKKDPRPALSSKIQKKQSKASGKLSKKETTKKKKKKKETSINYPRRTSRASKNYRRQRRRNKFGDRRNRKEGPDGYYSECLGGIDAPDEDFSSKSLDAVNNNKLGQREGENIAVTNAEKNFGSEIYKLRKPNSGKANQISSSSDSNVSRKSNFLDPPIVVQRLHPLPPLSRVTRPMLALKSRELNEKLRQNIRWLENDAREIPLKSKKFGAKVLIPHRWIRALQGVSP